ncbi:uncharacterized protein LOC135938044 [Cloeon dipterum]|uniref:uncharacterized protein LOC135938044 n=1 Tax=Cloeon dipterum TaxID=197152 RepID=UPI00322041FC
MTVYDVKRKPICRLLKAAEVEEKSLKASSELSIILICSIVFCVILLSLIILWLILRHRRNNSLPSNTNETQEMSVFPNEPPEYHEVQYGDSRSAAEYENVGAEEGLYEEVKYDQVGATPSSPGLYEQPICLSPRSARRVKAKPERPRTFEEFGDAPLAPVEYDDVGPPEPDEPLYDEVAPDYTTPRFDDTSESAQYLKILP